jgi:hypothetical protein
MAANSGIYKERRRNWRSAATLAPANHIEHIHPIQTNGQGSGRFSLSIFLVVT